MIRKFMGLGLLFLGSWAWIARSADVAPNFELWNKTDEPVYYFFGGSNFDKMTQLIKDYGITKLMPGEYTSPQASYSMVKLSGYNKMMMLSIGDLPGPGKKVFIIEFLPTAFADTPKKVYLELTKEGDQYSIMPQSGTLKSAWMKTEHGYSRSNLIKDKDYKITIKYLGFVPTVNQH